MADLPSIPIVRITVAELRELFNKAQIVERTVTGEFTEVIIHDGEPEPDKQMPPGTRSQMVSFRDKSDNEVARAHRFLLPDKSIGASGRPDPKRMQKDGVLYRIRKSEKAK